MMKSVATIDETSTLALVDWVGSARKIPHPAVALRSCSRS
jgi:hypothetical protein